MTLAQVLDVLRQVVAGLLHLHSLGILHRDLRAANVLVAGLDPLHVLLTDLGVSHLLSALSNLAEARASGVTASRVRTVLTGDAARAPVQVRAAARVVHCGRHTHTPHPIMVM